MTAPELPAEPDDFDDVPDDGDDSLLTGQDPAEPVDDGAEAEPVDDDDGAQP